MRLAPSPFKGRWKNVWMEMWDQNFVDEEVPGHSLFGNEGRGDFQFDYIGGSFEWSTVNDRADSLWEGNDEMDSAHGDMHCEITEGKLYGSIGLSDGDRSAFRAVRTNK